MIKYGYFLALLGIVGTAVGADAHPAATAAQWEANPEGAYAAFMTQVQTLLQVHARYLESVSWTGWVLAGLGTVVAVAKFVPGPWGGLVNLAWDILAPKRLKQEDEKQEAMASGFLRVARILKMCPKDSTIGVAIDTMKEQLPEEVKQAYRDWEENTHVRRPLTEAEKLSAARVKATAALLAEMEAARTPTTSTPST